MPKADRLLSKRLADIDHLRDVALANGNDRLLQKADELEALAREQYARRIGETGYEDDPSDPSDDFPSTPTGPSDPSDDFPTEPTDPIPPSFDFPSDPTEPIGDVPVSGGQVALSFEEVPTTVGTTSTLTFSEPTSSASTKFNRSTTISGRTSMRNNSLFPQRRRRTVYGYQYISGGQTQPVAGRDFGRMTSEAARMNGRSFGTNVSGQARLDGRGYGTTISNGVRYQNPNGLAFRNAPQFPTMQTKVQH